jgi:GNAT superfamily N-acetyltransferase
MISRDPADEFTFRRISAEETVDVRLPVLREGLPREAAIFDGDDAPGTKHFGVFFANRLVAVASIYEAVFPEKTAIREAWQLRGMATLPAARGRGCGRALLQACVEEARAAGGEVLWCNARTSAMDFYRRHGLQSMGNEFDIPGVGPHFRMWLWLREHGSGQGTGASAVRAG